MEARVSPSLCLSVSVSGTHTYTTHTTEHSKSFCVSQSLSYTHTYTQTHHMHAHTHIVTVSGSGQPSVSRYPSPFALPWFTAPESVPDPLPLAAHPQPQLRAHSPSMLPTPTGSGEGTAGPSALAGRGGLQALAGLPAPLPLRSRDRVWNPAETRGDGVGGGACALRKKPFAGSHSSSGPRVSPAVAGFPRSAAACPALRPAAGCPALSLAGAREGARAAPSPWQPARLCPPHSPLLAAPRPASAMHLSPQGPSAPPK